MTPDGIGAQIVDKAKLSAQRELTGGNMDGRVAGAEIHISIHPELVVPCARSCSLGRELNDSAVQLQIPGGEYGGRCDNTGTKLGGVQSAVVQGDISNRPRSPEGAHIVDDNRAIGLRASNVQSGPIDESGSRIGARSAKNEPIQETANKGEPPRTAQRPTQVAHRVVGVRETKRRVTVEDNGSGDG